MEYLGGTNLFASHFVIGCKEVNRDFTKTETIEIEAIHKWLSFKDSDLGMKKYHSIRTQYVAFLEIIELEHLKKITVELFNLYSKEYPYSKKEDFIDHVLRYSIQDLKSFLKLDLFWIGEPPNDKRYSFYTVYSIDDGEYLDFAISRKYDIEHYRQYYRCVLDFLTSFLENHSAPLQQNIEHKETELSESIKKHFQFFNGNCPRKHKQILKDEDYDKLIKWTICYFENNFKVPEISEPIKVVNTNKTFVQLAFKYLFKELHKSSPYPETLFEFYQSAFNPYSQDKKSNFEAVKNNDEVKRLMHIDY